MGACSSKDKDQRGLKIDWNRKRRADMNRAFDQLEGCEDPKVKREVIMKIFSKFDNQIQGEHIEWQHILSFLRHAFRRSGKHEQALRLSEEDAKIMIRRIVKESRDYITKAQFLDYLASL